ncbi:MAG: hypothetical protein J6D37_06330 [Clostridia bacterium]|nr:hypothetical protein [Clostridia bacterium]
MEINKKDITLWLNGLAFVLALVATIVLSIANNTRGFSLVSGGEVVAYSVIAVVLIAVVVAMGALKGEQNPITTLAGVAAIFLMVFAFGTAILERIDLFGGLFSWDNLNSAGWGIFYMTVAAVVLYLASAVLLIVSSFRENAKA